MDPLSPIQLYAATFSLVLRHLRAGSVLGNAHRTRASRGAPHQPTWRAGDGEAWRVGCRLS